MGQWGLSHVVNFLDPQGWDLGSAGLGPCIHMSGCLGIWAVQVWVWVLMSGCLGVVGYGEFFLPARLGVPSFLSGTLCVPCPLLHLALLSEFNRCSPKDWNLPGAVLRPKADSAISQGVLSLCVGDSNSPRQGGTENE